MRNKETVNTYDLEGYRGVAELEYFSQVNYVLSVNDFPTIQRLTITNNGKTDWRNVKVSFESPLMKVSGCKLAALRAGTSASMAENLCVELDLEKLIALTDVERTKLTMTVTICGKLALSTALDIELCPYSHWPGTVVRPELIAAYITPNLPIISRVVSAAEKILGEMSGSPAMDEYMSGDPNRVRMQVAAIYTALRREGLAYISVPPSFCEPGQRIRMPHEVLNEKHGTCLDLTLLMASCLEAVGLRPIILLLPAHAIVGAWLVRSSYTKAVGEDAGFLRKAMSDGINEMVLLETVCVTDPEPVSFEEAVDRGYEQILDDSTFGYFVDVLQARVAGVYPMPLRLARDGSFSVVNEGLEHQQERIEVRQLDRYDLSAYDSSDVEVTKFTVWERKLLDFSLRNSLLNMKMGTRMIPLMSFDIDKVENALQTGANFRVLPYPLSSPAVVGDIGLYDSSCYPKFSKYAAEELLNKRLHSFLDEEKLNYALKHAYRSLRTSIEENGSCNLFLVIGVLHWSELNIRTMSRLAPMILLPIDLVRAQGGHGYNIRTREEDATFNVTLSELLRQQHSIDLTALNELPKDESGVDVRKIFAIVRDKIRDKEGWSVQEEMLIGVFSFNKFVMWRDVHDNASKLAENDIVASLVDGKLSISDPQLPSDAREADAIIPPAEYTIPIDVDSSQMEAIIDSGYGRSFILHGPPGTGKSQTITNMIANALYQGKRVLFVAEKMAALDVVRDRLCKIGLDPFCLELHSNKATKRHFLDQMGKVLDVVQRTPGEEYAKMSDKLYARRKEILDYVEALHKKDGAGFSLHQCLSSFLTTPGSGELPFTEEALAQIIPTALPEVAEHVRRYDATVFRVVGPPSEHPLKDMRLKGTAYSDAERVLKEQLPKAVEILRILVKQRAEYKEFMGKDTPLSVPMRKLLMRLANSVEALDCMSRDLYCALYNDIKRDYLIEKIKSGARAQMIRRNLLTEYSEGIFNENSESLAAVWEKINSRWFFLRMVDRKIFLNRLKPYRKNITAKDVEPLIKTLGELEANEDNYLKESENIRSLFGPLAKKGGEKWDAMIDVIRNAKEFVYVVEKLRFSDQIRALNLKDWPEFSAKVAPMAREVCNTYLQLDECLSIINEYVEVDLKLAPEVLLPIMEHWADNIRHFSTRVIWDKEVIYLKQQGMDNVVEYIETQNMASEDLANALAKGFYHAYAAKMINETDALRFFNGVIFDDVINEYRALTHRFQELSKYELFCRLASRVPNMTMEPNETSELGILKRNIKNGGRGTSIRHLIDQIPTLLPRLCPCMLMSPISVAQYIDLDAPKFDIVVFDEASQMPTSEAVGAIARGKSLVVVGDPKQMPPTSFFSVSAIDEDEAHMDDMESILDDCITLSMPAKHLTWHYRSKHESLIAFSNSQYYDGRLITFPSVDDLSSKVSLRLVEGVYDRAHSRSNRTEAVAVVAEVVRRLSDPEKSKRSIGIVSFSKVQQDLIEDILTDTLATDPKLEAMAFNGSEPIFVKNLENVQGDERDVILFSVGYGPDKTGKVSMNFGPLNSSGGERRLNVAVSRARYEMVVFSSISHEQIDLRRTSAVGVVGLKHFLEYAEKGTLPVSRVLSMTQDDEDAIPGLIADELTKRGYTVQLNVGKSRFKVDVAVVHPSDDTRFLLGILCDGPQYHRTKTVRDREIVQPAVLRLLGWSVMRVWTLDWYNRKEEVIDLIVNAVEEAITKPKVEVEDVPAAEVVEDIKLVEVAKPAKPIEAYTPAFLKAELNPSHCLISKLGPYNDKLATQVKKIIKHEAPVSFNQLCERLRDAYFDLSDSDTQKIVKKYLEPYYSTDGAAFQGKTYWVSERQAKVYRKYRPESKRIFENIPVAEVANAMRYVMGEQLSMKRDELKRLAAAEFGVKRLRPGVERATAHAMSLLLREGVLKVEGDRVTLVQNKK